MSQYSPTGFRVLPLVVKNLLIINGLFFLATIVLDSKYHINLTQYLGLHYFESEYFRPHQFITHLFMHGGFTHLLFNMFALWMFGSVLENFWGPKRFLFYYLVTGLGAAALHTFVNWYSIYDLRTAINTFYQLPSPETFSTFIADQFPMYKEQVFGFISEWSKDPNNPLYLNEVREFMSIRLTEVINIPTVGASGAVFGLLLAFGMLFPNSLIYIYFFFPLKAKYFVMIYGAIELYSGFSNQPGDNVAHFAHLGGMIFGFFLIRAWKNKSIH